MTVVEVSFGLVGYFPHGETTGEGNLLLTQLVLTPFEDY
jgi:hypothetical protein